MNPQSIKRSFHLFLLSFLGTLCFALTTRAQQTFTNYQAASLVVGQSNFTSGTGSCTQASTHGPSYCAISSKGMLAVTDQAGYRCQLWNSAITANGQVADLVIGKNNFTTCSSGVSQSLTGYCNGVGFSPDGNKVIVADYSNNRVLIWNSIPTSNGQPADVVLGQTNFIANSSGITADKFNHPAGIYVSNSGKLIVSDLDNHRVLIWNSIPSVNGTPADVVVGQPNFTTATSGNTANKMDEPWGVWVSPDGKLLVADEENNRVLIFNSIPTSNNASADVVIGQTGFGLSSPGTSQTQFYDPIGVTVSPDGKLAIGEYTNNRVLIYNTIPTTNGAAADVVLGQASFTAASSIVTSQNMYHPYNVSFDLYGRLFVAGRDMNRVMIYGTIPTQQAELQIQMSVDSTVFCPGSATTITVTITNNGPNAATGVIATASLPASFTFASATASAGTYNSASGYWNISSLAPGATDTLTIVGASTLSGMYSAFASIIQSNQLDNNLSNNGTNIAFQVYCPCSGTPLPPGNTISTLNPVCPAESFTLSLQNINSFGGVTYQWQSSANNINFSNIAGAVGSTYTTSQSSAMYYRCIVTCSNSGLSATSSSIYITLNTGASIISQPSNSAVFTGGSTSFSVAATGGGLTYQWQVNTGGGFYNIINSSVYSNVTTATLNIANAALSMNGYLYRCVVTGTCLPAVTSNSAVLTVTDPPCSGTPVAGATVSTANPVCAGVNFTLSLSGASSNISGLTYQWQSSTDNINFTNIAGAVSSTYTTSQSSATYYHCIVTCTNSGLSATSSVLYIIQNVGNSITSQPSNSAIIVGANTSFSVSATGGGLTYQWQVNTGGGFYNISNSTIYSNVATSTLNITNATLSMNGYLYRCVVTGTCPPAVTSTSATLTVTNPPCSGTPAAGITVSTANPVCNGVNFTLSLSGMGTNIGGLTYQWQSSTDNVNFTDITGAITSPYITNQTVASYYRCIITCTNSGLTATSSSLYVGQNTVASITSQPANSAISVGGNTSFSVSATGTGLTYQWQVSTGGVFYNISNSSIYSGVNTATLNITSATLLMNGYLYRCVINGTCPPAVNSTSAILTVANMPCSGTPLAGSAVSTDNPVCAGISFILSLSGASTNVSGLTYQWQSSADNITYANIAGAISSTYMTSQSSAMYYRCIVTCTGSGLSATSAFLNVSMNPTASCYCSSSASYTSDEEIFNVTVGTLNNSSTCSTTGGSGSLLNRYSNYTTLSAPNLTGMVSFSIQIGTCGGTYPSGTAIFIDYNQNGFFTDPGEKVYGNTTTISGPHFVSGSFAVPTNALGGATVMRVINAESSAGTSITPCFIYSYGETEDYTVNITPSVPCSGTPSPGNTISSLNTVCASDYFTLSLQNANSFGGITYQWQSSSNNISFVNIAGAVGSTYTTSQSAATYYRCVVTCANGGLSATSLSSYVAQNTTASITSQPSNSTVSAGANTSFSISATGTGLTYQWQVNAGSGFYNISNSSVYSNVTTATLNITNVTLLMSGYQYRCLVNGSCFFTTTTNGGTLTVSNPPCSGTPTAGITVSTDNMVCDGAFFTLSLSGINTGVSGLTYQWQSSTNNITYTNIAGATSSTYSTSQSSATYYRCIVTCTNSGLSATSVFLNISMNSIAGCYCTSMPSGSSDEEIFNVTVGTLNNTSTCFTTGGSGSVLNSYSNFTNLSAPNLIGTVSFSIQIGTCGGNYSSGTAIFIDYNHNGSFADAGETVYANTLAVNGPHFVTGSFTVPTSAMGGATVMRVTNAESYAGTSIAPCLMYSYGETEDYMVNIVSSTPVTNDNCTNAIGLSSGTSCNYISGSTVGATQSIPAIICNTYTGDADDDVWYSFTAAASTHKIYVQGLSGFDPVVDLRSGACMGVNIACADATFASGLEIVSATGLSIGSDYFIRIYSYDINDGNFQVCITHDLPSGINEIAEHRLTVYPNPNNGLFTISAGEGVYSIMNELGQTVQTIKLDNSNEHTVNVENLNNGIYFIVGFNNNQLVKQKIVVAK